MPHKENYTEHAERIAKLETNRQRDKEIIIYLLKEVATLKKYSNYIIGILLFLSAVLALLRTVGKLLI